MRKLRRCRAAAREQDARRALCHGPRGAAPQAAQYWLPRRVQALLPTHQSLLRQHLCHESNSQWLAAHAAPQALGTLPNGPPADLASVAYCNPVLDKPRASRPRHPLVK
eukprot:481864-Prymnesium_polylepis.2